ncbi:MAG: 50S ribosomal protein L4, partial [Planctomycetota bacterium]|nr:50S ribosomal protein L4 [Planctomycetota bacterium]
MSAKAAETQVQTFKVSSKGPGGEDKGELSISSENLDDRVRYRLIKEAVVMYQANRRVGTHQTKTRAQIAGSGKKPWRQKGTGHARAGTRKSPIWRGGGVVFGPHPRDYSYSINKKQRRLALRSALYSKFSSAEVQVIDGLDFENPRTGELVKILAACGLEGQRVLIGTLSSNRNLLLSARNLKKVQVAEIGDFNTLEVLQADCVLLTKDAFDQIASGELKAEPEASEPEAAVAEVAEPEAEAPEAEAEEAEAPEAEAEEAEAPEAEAEEAEAPEAEAEEAEAPEAE